jgi:hypothetical protein
MIATNKSHGVKIKYFEGKIPKINLQRGHCGKRFRRQ